jgi:hypothetical protein
MIDRASRRNCVLRGTLALAADTDSVLDAITLHPSARTSAIRVVNLGVTARKDCRSARLDIALPPRSFTGRE